MIPGPPPDAGASAPRRPPGPSRSRSAGSPPRPGDPENPGRLQRLLYYLLLSILSARPLISESFERLELWFLGPAVRDLGPTPATTVILDALLLSAAAAAFALPARRHRPLTSASITREQLKSGAAGAGNRSRGGGARGFFQRTNSPTKLAPTMVVPAGVGLLIAAVIASIVAAGDKRLAANAGANLIATTLAGLALVRVISTRWMVHLLLAAALAGGVATAVKCILQKTVEFRETAAAWERHKQELARRGEPLDSPAIVNYERRLRAAEAFGYLYHPNVTASCLLLTLIPAGGLVGAALVRGRTGLAVAGASLLICAILAGGLVLTGSLGGMASAIAGAALLVFLALCGRGLGSGRILALLASGYGVIVAVILTVGLSTGRLPHESLAFRWEYWKTALRVYADAPLTGIGRQNFADGYLIYKSAASTEEVKDPHNLWLSLLVELGPLGLTAGLLLLGSCLAAGARGAAGEASGPAGAEPSFGIGDLLAPPLGVLLTVALCSGIPFDPLALGATWAVSYALLAWVLESQPRHAQTDLWLSAGLTAAMATLVLHALIDFALCTPAGLAAFVALAAAAGAMASGQRADRPAPETCRPAPAATAGAVAVLAVHLVTVAVPTVNAERNLARMHQAADSAVHGGPAAPQALAAATARAQAAAAADAWDPQPTRAAAETAARLSALPDLPSEQRERLLDLAVECATEARRRNTRSAAAETLLASIFELRWNLMREHRSDAAALIELKQAAAHAERAAELHPTDPRAHLLAGRLLRELWRAGGEKAVAARAVNRFRTALRIDALRKPEVAVKLAPHERLLIEEALHELEPPDGG